MDGQVEPPSDFPSTMPMCQWGVDPQIENLDIEHDQQCASRGASNWHLPKALYS